MNVKYPSTKQFLSDARSHQRKWVRSYLGVSPAHPQRVLIPPMHAFEGKMFIDDFVKSLVEKRYPKSFDARKDGFPKPIISDALRSEHIPFNLFGPLTRLVGHNVLSELFSDLFNIQVSSVDEVQIEHAPPNGKNTLKDNTSFDTFIRVSCEGSSIIIGIEVKYTEGSYPWGKTEKKRMGKASSIYNVLTKESQEFVAGARAELANIHLKQIWRNYLLSIASAKADDSDFVYCHFFPRGNIYQAAVCGDFVKSLTSIGKSKFRVVSYEQFISCARKYLGKDFSAWTTYLDNRYIVKKSV